MEKFLLIFETSFKVMFLIAALFYLIKHHKTDRQDYLQTALLYVIITLI